MISSTLFTALLLLPTTGGPFPVDSHMSRPTIEADSSWYHKGVLVEARYSPERALRWELIVPAPVPEVWTAWTDPAAMITWASPGAEVDLRVGGVWEVHFDPDRPEGQRGSDANEIIGLVDGTELVIAAGAPTQFPTVREEKTRFTVRLEPVGHGFTRLVVTQTGWKVGEEWEAAFDYLAGANAEWLSWLLRRYVSGPTEWPGASGT